MNEDAAITHGLRWLYRRGPLRGAIEVTAAREPFGSWVVELRAESPPAPVRIRVFPSGVVRELPPADDPAAEGDEYQPAP
ncbi:MAG TPA: hypothetical protein VGE07_12415 [Herpetosiphonaceae bacterium]